VTHACHHPCQVYGAYSDWCSDCRISAIRCLESDIVPQMLALAGDVAGRRILDAGCGSGPLLAGLRDRGAIVTGFRVSVVSEPSPAPGASELFPAEIEAKPRFLCFLFFVLEAVS
jgi:SAM-dependent methyltransferase